MNFLKGTFSIECENCKGQIDFQPSDTDFEPDGGSERQMGTENSYLWNYDFKCFDCKKQDITIDYGVYEYPVGAFNTDDVTLKGAIELSRFDYTFQDEELEQ